MQKRCETCKFAEWDYCEGIVPGSPRGYWVISGCTMTASQQKEIEDDAENDGEPIPKEYDDRWGDTKDCPYWGESI